MGREAEFRKDLSMPGMVGEMRRGFERIEDAVTSRGLTLSDCLMSGLAIFVPRIRRCCDELQKARCPLSRAALARKRWAKYFCEDFRSLSTTFRLPDWDTFYRTLAFGHEAPMPVPFDTS